MKHIVQMGVHEWVFTKCFACTTCADPPILIPLLEKHPAAAFHAAWFATLLCICLDCEQHCCTHADPLHTDLIIRYVVVRI